MGRLIYNWDKSRCLIADGGQYWKGIILGLIFFALLVLVFNAIKTVIQTPSVLLLWSLAILILTLFGGVVLYLIKLKYYKVVFGFLFVTVAIPLVTVGLMFFYSTAWH